MKNQYLILRMCPSDLYSNQYLMHAFNRKRIDQVIGVIVILEHSDHMYHLTNIAIDLLPSDGNQHLAKLSWSSIDRVSIEQGAERLPVELAEQLRTMQHDRVYHTIDTTIPVVFRDRHTKIVYTSSTVSEIVDREKTGTLDDFTVDEIVAHLKQRLGDKIEIKL